MKDWFYALQPRERLMVVACGAFVAIALLYMLVWAPIAARHAQLVVNVKAQREVLAWMRDAGQQVRQARLAIPNTAATDMNRSLLSIVDSTATQGKVRDPITRMEPEGDSGVRLSLENADFDTMVRWLGTLKGQYNVDVTRATITPETTPGRVDARLSLQRS
ncbi:MAG: type II secretion system protein M [Gammaproteobacteria bacterium]|nr:type II secretion system protein M [Gammaproteobacteria bacterium]